ncbi:MAG: malto-oligosyltrehalose synthase [Azospirillaceae bacterium]|nr:malto-oligosyltrehalose synthase [Azospirillaceae bacterium]
MPEPVCRRAPIAAFEPPRATYRLQLTKDFTFRDAAAIAGYLADLGISHAYLSPILMAKPGSTHGYDVIDHDRLNPELGTAADFAALATAFRDRGLGIIVDIVPNHMGIGDGNWRWMDVLEWGELSPEAGFFDIDWQAPRPDMVGKLLLPVLSQSFGAALDAGEIALSLDADQGEFVACCGGTRFPLSIASYGEILTAAVRPISGSTAWPLSAIARDFTDIDALAGDVDRQRRQAATSKTTLASLLRGDAAVRQALEAAVSAINGGESPLTLGSLLDRQFWRLAHWRTASDEINYRRFFAINELIGIRAERPEVFEATHRIVLQLVAEGMIDGLRIDHVDGLYDPKAYLERLRDAVEQTGRPAYILVEKILAHGEALPQNWPVAGTTGYDRLGPIDRLLVDPEAKPRLAALYHQFTGRVNPIAQILRDSKREFLVTDYSGEIGRLARTIHELACRDWTTRDITLNALERGLREIIAQFPVYRTYADHDGISATDRGRIEAAATAANSAGDDVDDVLYRFLRDLLTLDLAASEFFSRDEVLAVAMRFQQLSGPAMAKGMEDTAFYRYVPLLVLNEVGGDPDEFALDPADFHRFNQEKRQSHPDELIPGSTHDTKRGEDARARLACLSSMVDAWALSLERWHDAHAGLRTAIDGRPAPSANDEYYLYQTILSAWPPLLSADDQPGRADFAARIEAALLKAVREAKLRTSWDRPREDYETSVYHFAETLLTSERTARFRAELVEWQRQLGFKGALTSLSATLLRLTTPGVPDIYRGSETWNLALVDPDNRWPVDFDAARSRLATLQQRFPNGVAEPRGARTLVEQWQDGLAKTHLIVQTLATRRRWPGLFAHGDYQPLSAQGAKAQLLFAFARHSEDHRVIVVAPRLWPLIWPATATAAIWDDTRLQVPSGSYLNVLTGEPWLSNGADGLPVQALLANFPVALLVSTIS